MLGSSDYGAQLAAHLGRPAAFAYFFMDGRGASSVRSSCTARSTSRANGTSAPQATICVWRSPPSAPTRRHHALSRDHWRPGAGARAARAAAGSRRHRRTRLRRRGRAGARSDARQGLRRRDGRGGAAPAPPGRVARARRTGDQHLGLPPRGAAALYALLAREFGLEAQGADESDRLRAARRVHHPRCLAQGHRSGRQRRGRQGDGGRGPRAGGRARGTAQDLQDPRAGQVVAVAGARVRRGRPRAADPQNL